MHGAGHAWSGGSGSPKQTAKARTPADDRKMLLRFFKTVS